MAAKDGTAKRKRKNRHHIFFPRRAWSRIGQNARAIRGAFTIRISSSLHAELHYEVNEYLGNRTITRQILPDKDTIRHVKKKYVRQRILVRAMSPIEKLEWLIRCFKRTDRNKWTIGLLEKQLEFLQKHAEEI